MSNINNNPTIGIAKIYPMPNPTPINHPATQNQHKEYIPSASYTDSLHNHNLPSPRSGNQYRRIGEQYNVAVGQQCWLADSNGYYPCSIVNGSDIEHHENGSVSICIDHENYCMYFGLYTSKNGAEEAFDSFRDEIECDANMNED